jgi:hypothetical protein
VSCDGAVQHPVDAFARLLRCAAGGWRLHLGPPATHSIWDGIYGPPPPLVVLRKPSPELLTCTRTGDQLEVRA